MHVCTWIAFKSLILVSCCPSCPSPSSASPSTQSHKNWKWCRCCTGAVARSPCPCVGLPASSLHCPQVSASCHNDNLGRRTEQNFQVLCELCMQQWVGLLGTFQTNEDLVFRRFQSSVKPAWKHTKNIIRVGLFSVKVVLFCWRRTFFGERRTFKGQSRTFSVRVGLFLV